METSLLKRPDPAHHLLLPFLRETEILLHEALQTLDKNSSCKVLPAVDLGFPHDVVRIAGGFPTGCYVEWNSEVPFVPIDTTVNIDTSTVFELDDDISEQVDEAFFDELRKNIENSSYIFNFHKGNHFISFGRYRSTGTPVLVIHSNEKEFKYQYNGLMPAEDNWYSDEVKIIKKGDRYLRYISGTTAQLFIDIAKSLEEFNIVRHRFVAHLLTKGRTNINSQKDDHHYFMPSRQSVAIGCFPAVTGSVVPIFSRPGRDISLFSPEIGGNNVIQRFEENKDIVLVPHGWGKTCTDGVSFKIDYPTRQFTMSGENYQIKTLVSLGKDERLTLREFADDQEDPNSLFALMSHHCPGRVLDKIQQIASFTKYGYARHV